MPYTHRTIVETQEDHPSTYQEKLLQMRQERKALQELLGTTRQALLTLSKKQEQLEREWDEHKTLVNTRCPGTHFDHLTSVCLTCGLRH